MAFNVIRRRATAALLVAALICAMSPFCVGGSSSYAAGAQEKIITPPDGVKFIDVPDAAFTDKINNEEYYSALFGSGPSAKSGKSGVSAKGISWSDLPDFNWRTDWNDPQKRDQSPASSPVFPTRDQGAFGTCWAFASLASAQGSLVLGGLSASSASNYLSPYHLTFSAYNPYTFAAAVNENDRDVNTFAKAALNGGGNADIAASALSKWFGPLPEYKYAYPTTGNPSAITELSQLRLSSYHLQYSLDFPYPNDKKTGVVNGKGAASIIYSQLSAIKYALYTYGPMATSYYATGTYRQTGETYGDPANGSTTYYQTAKGYANHGVTLVGWNDDIPAAAFDNGSGIQPAGNGAFLIQNSWGGSWGDGGGFFWISYYDPSIGISTHLSLDNVSNYDNIYYWDDLGHAGAKYYNLSWYTGNRIDYMANVFTAADRASANTIGAAGVYASSPGTSFAVSVYKNPPAGKPSGGLPLKIGPGGSTVVYSKAMFTGYNTIVFANPQHLEAGDTFAVVVQVLNNNADDSALTCEGVVYNYAYESDHVAISKGESYYSSDGKSWKDLAATFASYDKGLGNFNIRAYSSGVGISSVGISPDYPVQTVYKAGEQFNYNAGKIAINYADGTRSLVPLLNNNVQVSGFDSSSTGTRTVTISFMGKTLSYNISVIEWTWVTGITGISGAPEVFRHSKNSNANYVDLSSSVSPDNASDRKINWSVTGPAVIESTGDSTARLTFTGEEGTVEVTAKSNDSARISKKVNIIAAANVTSIESPVNTVYMKKNSSYTIPCVAYDGDLPSDAELTFTSGDEKTLTVSPDGRVKAKSVKKKTKALVAVTAQCGYRKTFTFYIMPKAVKLKTLKARSAPKKMKLGSYRQLSLKYGPSQATNLVPKFTSSNPKVLSVDAAGRIIAVKKGKAKITIRSGGKKYVTNYIKVT
ncbi:MAG: lectin like domain-containing protein [Clostridiales Family XIII bacterium]|jgi:C1A family cysteine protease|nr:lectin like domain-containing protein [Clostridiales Family XIII bacterium]